MSLADDLSSARSPSKLGALSDLLERSGIDLDDISRVERVNVWNGFYKDDEGEAHTVDLHGISLVPKWADGPAWPVVDRPTIKVSAPKLSERATEGKWACAVVLPDIQAGYYRTDRGLEPTHDEDALSAALAVVKAAKPAQVILVGDNADLPEFGKYRLTPAFQQTTQATVDRLATLCAELRAAAPDARIVWLAGNHEERLPNFVLDNARAAFGLRQGNTPESWPVLSVPYLCRMDEHGVEYVPGYPASHHWVTPQLKVIHGELVTSNGSTAHKYLQREQVNVIYGHTHRREYAARVLEGHDGATEIFAASGGCLARTDGAVPSTKGATDLDGRPLRRHENWNQGLSVVPYDPVSGEVGYEQVAIRGGVARWRGKEYR